MIDLFYIEDGVKKGDIRDIASLKEKNLWIDSTDITKEEADILKDNFNLHPLTTEDLFNSHVRVKVEEFPEYLFCVFYGIMDNLELIELDYVLGKNFIITNHRKRIESYEKIKSDEKKIEELLKKGNDFLMHKLLDAEIDNFMPILEKIDDQIENLEEEVTRDPRQKLLTEVMDLKRQIVQIKKTTYPQREKISFIAKGNYAFISKKALPYFRDVYDHAIRVSDAVDSYRDAAGNVFDAYMSSVSNKMNDVMKVLSIIATIMLPLTVISGIYGTNFSVLPGAVSSNGFWVMIGVMIILVAIMMYFFKRKNWF